jgi:hypothetical protein
MDTDTTILACGIIIILVFISGVFISSSIYRGNTIKAMCYGLAEQGVYDGTCEHWISTRALHEPLRMRANTP